MSNANIKHSRPDYVLAFEVPPYTEIKHVKGHWYLYERKTIILPDGSRKKKSGHILGTITPNGFVESKKRRREKAASLQNESDQAAIANIKKEEDVPETSPEPHLNDETSNDLADGALVPVGKVEPEIQHGKLSDTVEVGAATYFYARTLDLRLRLKKFFPESWEFLYVISLLRVIYGPHFRRIKLHYQTSMLGEVFPGLDLGPAAIRSLLVELGKSRNTIRNFMLQDVLEVGSYLLVDGHRLITASRGRDLAELGYDSKMRYKPQINLLYLFRLSEGLGIPAYYKQYAGSTPDVTAFEDLLKDCGLKAENVIAVTDKGFASDDDFQLLIDSGLNYVIPLKRNNSFVKGKIPPVPADYTFAFRYNNRSIFFTEIAVDAECDFRIFLYLDISLYKEEMNTIVDNYEKTNQTNEIKVQKELERRKKSGKGKISDETLAKMKPLELSDVFENKKSIGTITLRVRCKDLNGMQAFCIWKTRQAIEQFFKTYDDTLFFDDSYMRDDTTEEGRLFLNHLSAIVGMNAIDELSSMGLSKEISLNDLRETLRTIHADCIDGAWMVKPIKSEVSRLTSKMELDIADLSTFEPVIKWGRNPDIQRPPVKTGSIEADEGDSMTDNPEKEV